MDLLPKGFTKTFLVTKEVVSSYLAISPLPHPKVWRYSFCDTVRHRSLSLPVPMLSHGMKPCGVRTFLPLARCTRSDRSDPTPVEGCAQRAFLQEVDALKRNQPQESQPGADFPPQILHLVPVIVVIEHGSCNQI